MSSICASFYCAHVRAGAMVARAGAMVARAGVTVARAGAAVARAGASPAPTLHEPGKPSPSCSVGATLAVALAS